MPAMRGKPNPPISPFNQLRQAQEDLSAAEAELSSLQAGLQRFEQELDALLGPLLDQLSTLEGEVQTLTAQVIDLRETRLFGQARAVYTGPVFSSPSPPEPLPAAPSLPADPKAELKALYRTLARRYHPDLARTESDRRHNSEQMIAINQAYTAGDLSSLRRLAGLSAQPGAPEVALPDQPAATELEQVQRRLRQVQAQINQLHALPIVQLSLEAKLARRQGRSLLSEMANDLRRKVKRKMAERDYLKSQLAHA